MRKSPARRKKAGPEAMGEHDREVLERLRRRRYVGVYICILCCGCFAHTHRMVDCI